MSATTYTDPILTEWAIADEVIRLRRKGTTESHELRRPSTPGVDLGHPRYPTSPTDLRLGAGRDCDIRLDDPTHRVSQNHALLFHKDACWNLLDVGSKNGLRVDGIKQYSARLEPGMEIGIGGVTLVAESPRYIELRSFLARLLGWGWGDETEEAVDRAMQSIRAAQRRRTPIALSGEGDLVPLARELHQHMFGADSPFVICDRRRLSGKSTETVRSPRNIADPQEALAAARGGTLCLRNERLPENLMTLLERVRFSGAQVQLVVCSADDRELHLRSAEHIAIPHLRSRDARQISFLINEYFSDAERILAVRTRASAAERAWILEHSAASIPEISKGTLRLTALRISESLAEAAERLDMKGVSLRRWLGRRARPPRFMTAKGLDEPELKA